MRKPGFCQCENKGTDFVNTFCFHHTDYYIVQYRLYLNPKFQDSCYYCDCIGRFKSGLVGVPEDQFSCDKAEIMTTVALFSHKNIGSVPPIA